MAEIEWEANEPYCRYQNRLNGTDYDCSNPGADYLDCFIGFLNEDLTTYQQALDLLGQLKSSNTYYDYYDLPEYNEYMSKEYIEILSDNDFVCSF